MTQRSYLILFLGADWWGSDARALAIELRKMGHLLIEVGYEDYLPMRWSAFGLRVVRRVIRPLCERNFNDTVLQHLENPAVDFVLVFKGMLLHRKTVAAFRARNVPVYCFYPDVSFSEHGANIAETLPEYDCLFTTKQFHQDDPALRAKLRNIAFVPHGYDPAVHRPVNVCKTASEYYGSDVSFAGCWSPKKERLIAALIAAEPSLTVKVWGTGWERSERRVRDRWAGRGAFGDELAIVYQTSKVNLGLLSEAGADTKVGDQVTARTWQIPASGGFLLHEETPEVRQFFEPAKEIATFLTEHDLASCVAHYLANPQDRIRIAEAGYRRCLDSCYSYEPAARTISAYHSSQGKSDEQGLLQ